MADYSDPVGKGGIWVKEGKKGKYLSWSCTFAYNGHQVTARGVGFKNEKKEGNQPEYKMIVNDAKPAEAKDIPKPKPPDSQPEAEEDIPF